MRPPQRKAFFACVLAVFCLLAVLPRGDARAQWTADSTRNTMICDTVGQQDYPAIVSDGADGAIVTWEDARANGSFDIYAQRIDRKGIPQWTRQGIQVCKGSANQRYPVITTDNNGGAYVAWLDSRFSTLGNCIYAQHIKANGTLAYPDTGLPVGLGKNGRQNPAISDDGRGNAFIAWEDNRSITSGSQPDIFMNKLWPGGVKYVPSTNASATGASRRINLGFGNWKNEFDDPNAHFKSKGYGDITNMSITIGGKLYAVGSVTSDTSLTLATYPPWAENLTYYFAFMQGLVVDTSTNKQHGPSVCSDGTGGCYLAWETGATLPNSISAMHFDSACATKWTTPMGYTIYKGQTSTQAASNVTIKRDTASGQMMMTWEVTSAVPADGQDVWTTRLNCATPADSSLTWGGSVQLDAILDQLHPDVFSDDSDVTPPSGRRTRGVMLSYRTGSLGAGPNDWDIGMTRLKGDGTSIMPAERSWYKIVSQPLGQVGHHAVKVDNGMLLAVWNDARNSGSPDTCIYAQVVDRWGWNYLPTKTKSSSWGIPICHGNWTAKQVVLAPRTGGAIAAWCDFRKGSGNPSIYAQLIMKDGSMALPYAKADIRIQQTGSFDGSACNSRTTSGVFIDSAKAPVGFDSLTQVSATNMTLQTPAHNSIDTVPFIITVTDSMKNGQMIVRVVDTAGNAMLDTITYCTIPDTHAPAITTKPFVPSDTTIGITLTENQSWDRGMDSVKMTSTNFGFDVMPTRTAIHNQFSFSFTGHQIDTTIAAQINLTVVDLAGNKSFDTLALAAKKVAGQGGVSGDAPTTSTLRVYPNPSTDNFTIDIGQTSKPLQAELLDVLGRTVAQFSVQSSTNFDASALPAGTYILRVGGMSTSIVKQ